MKKTEDIDTFYKVKHRHEALVTSLDYANIHKSIIYVTTRVAKCTNLNKTPITQPVEGFMHPRKTSDIFQLPSTGMLSLRQQKPCSFRFLSKVSHSYIVFNSSIRKPFRQKVFEQQVCTI